MNELTVCPPSCVALALPGATAINDGMVNVPAGVSTGASFRLDTVIEAVSDARENALEPPLVLVSTFAPATPAVWSQAR